MNIPKNLPNRKRIVLAASCKDCNYIPKVANAGEIVHEDGADYQIMHNGLKVIKGCYYGRWMTEIIRILKGHHEPQEEKAFYEVLKSIPENATMIELGSFWGYYSMMFNKSVKGAKNHLIEPLPENLKLGRKHFKINGMTATFYQAAIGKNFSAKRLYGRKEVEVPTISIDYYANKNGIDYIDLLHSDIQGQEHNMLQGCKKLMSKQKIGFMFISTHGPVHQQCVNFLKKHKGYTIIVSHSPKESYSVDGLIVAKAKNVKFDTKIKISKRK